MGAFILVGTYSGYKAKKKCIIFLYIMNILTKLLLFPSVTSTKEGDDNNK